MFFVVTPQGIEFFESKDNEHLLELCFTWLGDCVFTIREVFLINREKLQIFSLFCT